MKSSFLVLTVLLTGFNCALAYDAGQYLAGQLDGEQGEEQRKNDSPQKSAYLSNTNDYLETMSTIDPETYAIPGMTPELVGSKKEKREQLKNVQEPMGKYDDSTELISISKSELFEKYYRSGSGSFSFSYFRLNHKSNNSAYSSMFDSEQTRDLGGILIHFDKFVERMSSFEIGYSLGTGIGFRSGRGQFSSAQTMSNTTFKLWTIPIDAHLAVAIPLWKFSKLYASGGPAGMILLQNRSDFNENEDGKNVNQVSYGYSARAALRISLSNMFVGSGQKMFRAYNVTNAFLSLEGRYDSFNNFQDDFSISGASMGAGFTFEYF
ncbi:MAG: hypothetical protein KAG61_04300 [Bacteriovoracaceae bacterium]|nr:hypothetical protein [Bacteriovoracaceae bacterium]